MSGPQTAPSLASFRFYAELNDFLPRQCRARDVPYLFHGTPSIKDAIEAQGVPHPEIDLILVNGVSVGFDHRLQGGDQVSVYPVFEALDITPAVRLRMRPLRRTRFVADGHLGKLARELRLLGFDTLHRQDYADADVVHDALRETRLILTRDRGLLRVREVTHGYWVRATDPLEQAREVLGRLDLASQARPFTRCTICNGLLSPVRREEILERLPPRTRQHVREFVACAGCGRLYWRGHHYEALLERVARLLPPGTREDSS